MTQPNGEPLPFAADVLDNDGKNLGSVSQASKVFAHGIADQGVWQAKWSDTPESPCRNAY